MRPADIPRAGKGEIPELLYEDLLLHGLVMETKDEAIPERPLPEPGVNVDIHPAGVTPQPYLTVAALTTAVVVHVYVKPQCRTRFVNGRSISRLTPRRAGSVHGNSGDQGGDSSDP